MNFLITTPSALQSGCNIVTDPCPILQLTGPQKGDTQIPIQTPFNQLKDGLLVDEEF